MIALFPSCRVERGRVTELFLSIYLYSTCVCIHPLRVCLLRGVRSAYYYLYACICLYGIYIYKCVWRTQRTLWCISVERCCTCATINQGATVMRCNIALCGCCLTDFSKWKKRAGEQWVRETFECAFGLKILTAMDLFTLYDWVCMTSVKKKIYDNNFLNEKLD